MPSRTSLRPQSRQEQVSRVRKEGGFAVIDFGLPVACSPLGTTREGSCDQDPRGKCECQQKFRGDTVGPGWMQWVQHVPRLSPTRYSYEPGAERMEPLLKAPGNECPRRAGEEDQKCKSHRKSSEFPTRFFDSIPRLDLGQPQIWK